jgi:hypothetical protein
MKDQFNNPDSSPSNTGDETWDEIYEEYSKDEYPPFGGPFTDALEFIEWLKIYYNEPKRKRPE